MNVTDVLNEMRRLGKDTDDAVWTAEEKLVFMNRAVKLLCQLKPNIHTSREAIVCQAGSVQNVPPGMRFVRVVGTLVGDTLSKAIIPVDEVDLTGYLPAWRSMVPVDYPEHYIFAPSTPHTFELYPPVADGTMVQIIAETFPDDATVEDDLPLPQEYFEPVCLMATAVMLYENDPDLSLVQHHLNRVSTLLGVKAEVEHAVSTD